MLLGLTTIARKNKNPTMSTVMREWGWKYSSVAFIAGGLIAHWFFNREGASPLNVWGYATGLPVFGFLMLFDFYMKDRKKKVWFKTPAIYVGLGMLWGYLFWNLSIPNL